ncbi:MAG TPA: dihydropyrimidinase [Actinomycetes bacterium]|nr:dihydropyrimidinase [Actinomycetes bacterium]
MRTLIRGGTVVTAGDTVRADVLVEDERIAAVVGGLDVGADRVIDATGRYVLPGGVDVHTHMELESAGTVASDDFATGTAAAAWGGTTTIIDYAGHEYGEPLGKGLERWLAKAAKSCIDYGLHMMVREVDERVLADMGALMAEGVTSFKLFMAYPGAYMVDDAAIFRALGAAAELGALIVLHAENGGPIGVLVERNLASGRTAPRWHALSRPSGMEGEATARAVALAELAGAPVHIAHLSAAEALMAVRRGRERGVAVTAETCPQYLFLSLDDLDRPGFEGAKFVCSPPLRTRAHQDALWEGLRLGDLQAVATDHCPFNFAGQKELGRASFARIPNGLPGVEDRFTLLFQGVRTGRIGLERFADLVATGPAKLFGLYPRKGTVAAGSDADVVVFDPDVERDLSAATHHMNVDYSCYEGLSVRGAPELVMQRGRVLVEDGVFKGASGNGRFLARGRPSI